MAESGKAANRFAPVTLVGNVVRLVPLRLDHAPLLWEAAKDTREEIFRWFPMLMDSREDFRRLVDKALDEQVRGQSVPFATEVGESGVMIGSTRFMNIDAPNHRVEIGTTWIVPEWQRTAVNTEAKYLMLRHAFEEWACLRVEFKTDALNHRSREAIRRIGAQEEGTLRKHMAALKGRQRDSVYFSIIDSEWPEVKACLEGILNR
jgi:RimJ/RimL family protein N-acetyltransferase